MPPTPRPIDLLQSLTQDRYDSLQSISHEMLAASAVRKRSTHQQCLVLLSGIALLYSQLHDTQIDPAQPVEYDTDTQRQYLRMLEQILALGAMMELPLAQLLRSKSYRYERVQHGDVPNGDER